MAGDAHPGPMTISHHTVQAVSEGLHRHERLALLVQSRVFTVWLKFALC
jgi:hypothetical protein